MADESYSIPIFSIVCSSSYDKVVKRSDDLELRFKVVQTLHPGNVRIKYLYDQYVEITTRLELDKLSMVISAPAVEHVRINDHFNHQRDQLITYMESQLEAVEKTSNDVNWTALKLMQDWYDKNEHFPYPSDEDLKRISKDGNISLKNVETWFHFERTARATGKRQ